MTHPFPSPDRQTRKTFFEAVAFVGVGTLNTLMGYAIFALLWTLLGTQWHYLSVLALTYGIVMLVGFVLYRELVFRSKTPWQVAVVKYVTVVLGSVAINSFALIALIEHANLPVLVSQAIGITMAAAFSYWLHKGWTFRP